MALLMMAGAAQAQAQQTDAPLARAAAEPAPAPDAAQGDITTLGQVRALKPEDGQPLDLYRFRNPMQPAPNRFSRDWSEPPSPEQVSQGGGYLLLGINYGLMAAAKGLHKLSGGRDQIQTATARPPPLSDAQLRRAAMNCEAQGC
ncbi:hypothetical protein [Stenotrophomonas sp. YIM B06876]|uniref:hypothetical protein n=1 Tax=Stenotrophomonas sp. YIM B06876 TaxID=3060211 RepID=UPI0027396A0E|nr:hypothetical protein [Stenotrophomonas sp. YIM B06876]